MGAGTPLVHLLPDDRLDAGRRGRLRQARARGRPVLRHQDDDRQRRVAGRDGRRHARPGHRPHREGTAAGRQPRLHPELHDARQDDRLRAVQGHHQSQAAAGPLLPGAQAHRRHPQHLPRHVAEHHVQRRVRRRLRQRLRLHGGRPVDAPAPRLRGGRALRGTACPQHRQDDADRNAGRIDLPRRLPPQARRTWHRHAGAHQDAAGAERHRAVRGGAGRRRAGLGACGWAVRIRGEPESHQPAG